MDNIITLKIYTDGGSRGNPGDAALGVYIENQTGDNIKKIGKTLGVATNNVAEYSAIREALGWVKKNLNSMPNLIKIDMFMDSQLAASQLNGIYKIKNAKLREILFEIKKYENEITLPITYTHIPREQNKNADAMVNLALDNNKDVS